MWCPLGPVVGNALCAVGDGDRAALAESKGIECTPHRCVVLVGVAAKVIRMLSCEREDRPSDTSSSYRGHAVNHVVVGVGMPRAIDLGVGLVWPGTEREDGEGPLIVGHKEAVPARDVLFCVNPARVSVGPLSRIPICLHERAGSRIRALDKLEVVSGGDSNLHNSSSYPEVAICH